MKNNEKGRMLFDVMGDIEDKYIEEAYREEKYGKKGFPAWAKIAAAAACFCLCAGAALGVLLSAGPEPRSEAPQEVAPNFTVNDVRYIISGYLEAEKELPEGYEYAGEVDVYGNEDCSYYTNDRVPEWIYVRHSMITEGDTDANGILITFDEPQMRYVKYVDGRIRGKHIISYKGDCYISMWSAVYWGEHTDLSEEHYAEIEDKYTIRIEGEVPEGFECVGKAEFTGYESQPEGSLASNFAACEVYADPDDPEVLLAPTVWYTATEQEKGETRHRGYNVFVKCPYPVSK